MKNLFLLTTFLFSAIQFSFAQAPQPPQAIGYQGAARNSAGNVLVNQNIALKISILQGSSSGTVLYSERHTITTNEFGLFDVNIGVPTSVISGDFTVIDWSTGNKYVKVEMDETGGTTYALMGTQQLVSVPFALYAANAGNGVPGIGFRAGLSADQTVTSAIYTALALTSEEYDDGNNFTGSHFTAPSNGVYHFDACLEIGNVSSSAGIVDITFWNNATYITGMRMVNNSSAFLLPCSSTDMKLNAGDIVEVKVFNGFTGNKIVYPGSTFFSGHKVY